MADAEIIAVGSELLTPERVDTNSLTAGWLNAQAPVQSQGGDGRTTVTIQQTSDRAILLWSPDSKKIATQQQDERKVGDWHLVATRTGRPELRSWKYPLPGDSVVQMVHRVVIDVDAGKVIRLKMAADFHRATLGDNLSMNDYKWSPDGAKLAIASTSRDHKITTVRVADAATGDVRDVFTETVATHFESVTGWQVLWATNELLWYSQRDDWGQLYLYDLATGKVKNKVTSGEGPVTQIVKVDEKARTLWYRANGREPGQDPYFAHAYRIGLDGKGPQVSLTPDDGTHTIQLSPSGKYLVDTYSKPEMAPVVAVNVPDVEDGRERQRGTRVGTVGHPLPGVAAKKLGGLDAWLVGDRIGLHPVAVIFALLAFGQLFGFTGILLALPASAALLVWLRHVRGEYLASESSFYRVLRAHQLQHHRGRAAAPQKSEPKRHQARGPNEVWLWDSVP